MNFFNVDGPVFTFLNRMADLFIVNVLFILCCLPVFTIGASITAMYTVTLKMARNREGYIVRSFFKAFKDNFKQATIIWIPSLVVLVIMLVDIRILNVAGNENLYPMLIGSLVISFAVILILMYVFPVLAKFENTTARTVKNAFLMESRHLPYTLCILLINVVPVVIITMLPRSLSFVYMLWLLFGFSLTALCNSYIFDYKIFSHYIPAGED